MTAITKPLDVDFLIRLTKKWGWVFYLRWRLGEDEWPCGVLEPASLRMVNL
jgi:hypothetical protein